MSYTAKARSKLARCRVAALLLFCFPSAFFPLLTNLRRYHHQRVSKRLGTGAIPSRVDAKANASPALPRLSFHLPQFLSVQLHKQRRQRRRDQPAALASLKSVRRVASFNLGEKCSEINGRYK